MTKEVDLILSKALERINPTKEELESIDKFLKSFITNLGKKLKGANIDAEVFVGGSFAKKTLIKKGQYDIDVFVRFDEKHKGAEISNIVGKALHEIKELGKISLIHGSRDYFKIDADPSFFIEVVPVMKIKIPKDAENITDLSYFHVNYIKRKLKTEKMLEEVRLAKAFCHANKCYGAEGYIHGFSGYALELLVYHYKGFFNFVKGISKIKEKEIIDIEKQYKNKNQIMMNMNSAKLGSPIILIDPTYKERNALAALSEETFEQFKNTCKQFVKKPPKESFEIKKVDLEKIRKNAQKTKAEFILIKLETDKQEGDIAGSKLAKFYRHLGEEIEKFYKIIDKGFDYNEEKEAESFFAVKSKGGIILNGPEITDKENAAIFKKKHKDIFVKEKRIYAKEKIDGDISQFIQKWKSKNKEKMKEMHIIKLNVD